ncbi:MAG: DUF2339 domain-containing protein [Ignavibacteria bacterium]|nr:DUF2339 domain-containing protein [Ignavibacteria bacterium]
MPDLDSLAREIRDLRERMSRLEEALGGAATTAAKGTAPKQPAQKTQASPPPPSASPPAASASFKSPAPKRSLEDTIGTRWFNLIGAIALIIAVGFFLQYAIENEWIGPIGRVSLGLLFGIGMILWGDILRGAARYRILSVGMNGIGISALYLSIYAAYDFYSLIPQGVAFAFMALVTAASVFFALRYNSLTIAFVALIGGFLTPALVSSGENRPVALFTYLLILDAGVLALALYKEWRSLNLFSVLFSYVWFMGWYITFYSRQQMDVAFTFLTLFFLLFAILAFVRNILTLKTTNFLDGAVIIGNAVIYFPFALAVLKPHEAWHGLFSLAVAALYLGLGAIAYRRNPGDRRLLFLFLSLAVTALVIAVPLQLQGRWITIAWATEALALWYIGHRLKSEKTNGAAFILFFIALARLLAVDSDISIFDTSTGLYTFTPILNGRFMIYAWVMGCLFTASFISHRMGDATGSLSRVARTTFMLTVAAGVLLALSLDVEYYFDALEGNARALTQQGFERPSYSNASRLTLSGVWAIYSMVLIGIGFARKNKQVRILAMVLFGITIFKVFLYDLSFLQGFYRITSLFLLGLILLLVSFLYQKYKGIIDEQSANP